MLKTIIDYVKYHYKFCENIESYFLTNNLDTNECYIKSCLVYKNIIQILYYIIEKIDKFYTNHHKTLMFYQKV